ncbi:MAG TPA: PAS domain S-box protein [Vicinamibacteria bacterium]
MPPPSRRGGGKAKPRSRPTGAGSPKGTVADEGFQILDHLPVATVLQGPRGEIAFANAKALELLGLTREQLLGQNTLDPAGKVIHENGAAFTLALHPAQRAIAERKPVHGVLMGILRPATRDRLWLLVDAFPELDQAGEVRRVICTFTDVTARREAERRMAESQEGLRILIESLGDALLVHDLEGRIVECNRRACDTLGYPREELLALNIADVDRRQTRVTLLGRLGRDRDAGVLTGEGLHCRKDGTTFPVEVRVAVLRKGENPLFVSTARDISERKQAEEAIHRSERRYRALFEDSLGFISTHDEQGVFLAVNPAAAEALGHPAEMIVGRPVSEFLAPEVKALFPAYLAEVLQKEKASGLMKIVRSSGEHRVWRYRNALQRDGGGVSYVIGFAQDVTELMTLAQDQERMALTDPLTGLGNRRAGEEAIQREVARARRLKTPLSFVFIDVDHFKAINDQRGHAGGDEVLCQVAHALKAVFRTSDTLVRWGGEEFLGILAANDQEGARVLAEKVRLAIETLQIDGLPRITVSAGTAELRPDEEPAATLQRADTALYRAKAEGRNRVR